MRTRGWVFTVSLILFMVSQAHGAYFRGLGDTTGGIVEDNAYEISADGTVVVGCGEGLYADEAFRWTLTEARRISADGSTIIGYGLNPDGDREAWVAHIDAKTSAPILAPPTGLRIVID
jgi:hypothetical protein